MQGIASRGQVLFPARHQFPTHVVHSHAVSDALFLAYPLPCIAPLFCRDSRCHRAATRLMLSGGNNGTVFPGSDVPRSRRRRFFPGRADRSKIPRAPPRLRLGSGPGEPRDDDSRTTKIGSVVLWFRLEPETGLACRWLCFASRLSKVVRRIRGGGYAAVEKLRVSIVFFWQAPPPRTRLGRDVCVDVLSRAV